MSDTPRVATITQEQIREDYRRLLAKFRLSWDEFVETGYDCTRQCGCALYDVDPSGELAWAWKNRDILASGWRP